MTLDEAITDLESCLANDWPGEWLNVEALELVLKELKATVMDAHKHHPVYRIGELESELEVARSLTKEALDQVAKLEADPRRRLRAKLEQALDEARAQIAAKDAEIKKLVEALERRGELIFGREGD